VYSIGKAFHIEAAAKGGPRYNTESTIEDIIKEKQYQYIFVDCGNVFDDLVFRLFRMATDIVMPIGEHSYTSLGMATIGSYLSERKCKITVWPVFSLGVSLSNKYGYF